MYSFALSNNSLLTGVYPKLAVPFEEVLERTEKAPLFETFSLSESTFSSS